MPRFTRTLLAAALAAAAFAGHAAAVKITFDNPIFNGTPSPGYDAASITFPAAGGPGSQTLAVAAGRFQGSASELAGITADRFVDNLADVWMYCYDVYETIGSGRVVTYTVNFDGASDLTLAFLGAVNAVRNAGNPTPDRNAWLHPTTAYEAAAIQLGIWESLYDSGWDLGAGAFRATQLDAPTASALASYFARVGQAPALERQYTMVLEAQGAQDMITGDPPGTVPEPGTLSLLLAPLALLALGRRRSGARVG